MGTTPTSRLSSSLPRNTGRFGYSLRMQSGARQVSTSTISSASFDERASYRLKLLRQLPDTSGPCGAPFSFPRMTSSARRTRSGEGSKAGAVRAVSGWILTGAEAAGGRGGSSGWPAETQGCGLKQRGPQPRAERLPLREARANWQPEPDPKGPSLPLLPIPIFPQPEQVQSKEYVTAARPPAGCSKAHASTTKTEFGVKRKLFEKQLTCCDRNRQGKNCDIKPDTQRKIDQRIPRRIGFEFPQRDLIAPYRAHVEARAAEYLRAPLLGGRDRAIRRATGRGHQQSNYRDAAH